MTHPAGARPHEWLRFVQLPPFPGQWDRLKMTGMDLEALENLIMAAPKGGTVVPGAGGLRKIRFGTPGSGRGKSGSYRVFYVDFEAFGIVILWAIIAKGEKADLSKAERDGIAGQIQRLRRLLEQGVIR